MSFEEILDPAGPSVCGGSAAFANTSSTSAVSPNFMAAIGARLVDNGYRILPITPGTKIPGRYGGGDWHNLPGWTEYCSRPTTEVEVARWSTWPGAGIGIAAGGVVGIDIDVNDADVACRIADLACARLGETPAVRIGKAPKRLLVYRAETPFRGFKVHPLEVLAEGQQFVAYALHPQTGEPYTWPNESLADLDIGQLPVIDEAQARAFAEEAYALLPESMRQARLGSSTGANGGGPATKAPGDLLGTPAAIAAALEWIPNPDLGYDDWIRIGLAIKGALGDAGAQLFADWSARSGKNVADYTARTWAGLKPRAIGAGTIYHYAIERGWSPDPSLTLNAAIAALPPIDISGVIQQGPSIKEPPPPVDEARIDVGDLDGVLGELVRYMIATARRPQPVLAVGASLCALGALMGRKYRTESNLRSNLYVVGVADSGSGKNHSREIVTELFVAAGLADHLGGNKIASGAGLLTALHRQPSLLFQLDEFGMLLSAATDRKRSPRHITEILDNMTELYSSAGSVFFGAEYANRDGKNPRRDISEPCLCVYGTTTPGHFWGALQAANVVDGSLARFIVLHSGNDYPDEQATTVRQVPRDLLAQLQQIAAGGGGKRRGNLAGVGSSPEFATDPLVVPASPEAEAIFKALSSETTTRLREARGTTKTPLLARIGENARKVALILAVSANPANPVIRAIDAEWAIDLVRSSVERTLVEVERHVADNVTESYHKRVLAVIEAAGPAGLSRSEISRRTQFLDRRQRTDILGSLEDAGQIVPVLRPSATRTATVYRVRTGVVA